ACPRRLLLQDKSVMPNCYVKVSPHGDLHDEQKGSAAGGAAEGAARGQGDERAGGRRPAPERPTSAAAESTLPDRGGRGPAAPQSRPARDAPLGERRPHADRRAAANPLRGLQRLDRKSTRLNSSHVAISYAVFCLK